MGLKKGFDAAGYDPNTYDFGSCIGDALQDGVHARRWRQKKKAFVHSIAKEPEGFTNPFDQLKFK